MLLLEGSDTQLKFRISEVQGVERQALQLNMYREFLAIMRFADDSILKIPGTPEGGYLIFDIFGEKTKGKEGVVKMDIWGLRGVKKIRFNTKTIKGKVLASISVPNF